jgi:hypothetical protein
MSLVNGPIAAPAGAGRTLQGSVLLSGSIKSVRLVAPSCAHADSPPPNADVNSLGTIQAFPGAAASGSFPAACPREPWNKEG